METVSSKQWMAYARRGLMWVFSVGYIAFPIGSGTWFYDRFECVYPWSEIVKTSLSAAAYVYAGFFVYGLTQPKDERGEASVRGLGLGLFFGGMMGFNVWQKCF
jgi:hypothetical protein